MLHQDLIRIMDRRQVELTVPLAQQGQVAVELVPLLRLQSQFERLGSPGEGDPVS